MKVYKYSRVSFVIQMVLIIGLIALLLFICYKFNIERFAYRSVFLVLLLIISIPFVISVYKRKIILKDEIIHFISFFDSIYTSRKERDFSVKYVDIKSIELKKVFIPQKASLKIKVKNRSKLIFIEFNMVNHKELFEDLCYRVKQQNPDAYIDKRIYQYIER